MKYDFDKVIDRNGTAAVSAVDLITGQEHDFGGGSELPGYSAYFWKCER